jgi:hypothetical protein
VKGPGKFRNLANCCQVRFYARFVGDKSLRANDVLISRHHFIRERVNSYCSRGYCCGVLVETLSPATERDIFAFQISVVTRSRPIDPWASTASSRKFSSCVSLRLPRGIDKGSVSPEGEHLIVGGRTKGLKTMLTLDMMVSLASGKPFLGHFPVTQSPVAFMSGESGKGTLQRAAKRMAQVRGAKITDDNFFIGFDLPRLSRPDHLAGIESAVRKYGIKLLCIDPAYLATLTAGNADKASNQFAMGLILEPYGRIGVETGCTMALVHHARKTTRAEAYQPMTRDDLTQSGFDAWMRQWLLISRRSAFQRGLHELHVEVGGSAGHNGEWHVTVDEGQDDPLVGRRWTVTVTDAETARADGVKAAANAKAEREALDITQVRSILLVGGNVGMSKSAIRDKAAFNSPLTERVIAAMLASGQLEECEYSVGDHKPKPGGYRLTEDRSHE